MAVVGIVVPAYNAQRWLARTLASLRHQSFTDWVCVVVDDGSTDDTAGIVIELAKLDARLELISQPNAGMSAARNAGMAALPADCTFVAFLDSDDLYEPDALETLVRTMAQRPDAVGAHGLADYIDEFDEPLHPGLHLSRQRRRHAVSGWRLKKVPPHADATFETLAVYGSIWPPAVAIHRLADVRKVGGFDPAFFGQEDWELFLRLSRRGPYAVLDRRIAWYRRHGLNITADHDLVVFQQQHVRRQAYLSPHNSARQASIVARACWLLEARQIAVLARQSLRSLRRRQTREAGRNLVGAALCLVQIARLAPPDPSNRRLRYTRPTSHPTAQLIPDTPAQSGEAVTVQQLR